MSLFVSALLLFAVLNSYSVALRRVSYAYSVRFSSGCYLMMAAWHSGSALVSINKITPHGSQLVLSWTAGIASLLILCITMNLYDNEE